MINKNVVRILLGCVVASFIGLACTAFSFAWFLSSAHSDNQAIDGKVALRDYFYNESGYHGDGSLAYPYEIVTPTHFYNFTRLQNLGVFSSAKYFRIGHETIKNSGVYKVKASEEPNAAWVNFLDLTDYFSKPNHKPFTPIGNEATPFYGIFDGNSIPVKGLKIAGDGEDIGIFGYIAHSSQVNNFICTNIEVSTSGYIKKDTETEPEPQENEINYLYWKTIDNIFTENTPKDFETASLTFTPAGETPINLKKILATTSPDSEQYTDNLYLPNSPYANGVFELIPPTLTVEGYEFEYSLLSSTSVIEVEKDNSGRYYKASIHIDRLPDVLTDGKSQLAINESAILNSSLSIIASVKVNGVKYSRVIQSYSIEFKRLADLTQDGRENQSSKLLLKIDCDYYKTQSGQYLNATHGYNIGFIVGHADGNVSNCYVYNGLLNMNTDKTNYVSIAAKSETGLIGKIGDNVTTNINPIVDTPEGDTGVLNLSHIYSQIRNPFSVGDNVIAGALPIDTGNNEPADSDFRPFVAYAVDNDAYTPESWNVNKVITFNNYSKYLRTFPQKTDGEAGENHSKYYVTYAKEGDTPESTIWPSLKYRFDNYNITSNSYKDVMNSVDFTWNQVIEDEQYVDRGLGVFKIVTAHKDIPESTDLSDIWLDNIGDFSIHYLRGNQVKDAIYFSTAECDWTKTVKEENNSGNLVPVDGWNKSNYLPARMNTLPTFSEEKYSFQWPFSRDFNYVFKLNLTEADKFIDSYHGMQNYMFQTDSDFLKNYLQSVLITSSGTPMTPKTPGFGFKVQFSQGNQNKGVKSLNSYIKVGIPGEPEQYTASYKSKNNAGEIVWTTKDDVYLPPKSIVFEITNDRGANVSIAGNGNYISIYSYDPVNGGKPEELYTMFSKNVGGVDSGRYFAYSIDQKYNELSKTELDDEGKPKNLNLNTKTVVTPDNGDDVDDTNGLSDSGYLYGHIFHLEKGHYVIGCSEYLNADNPNATANIYYVAVQGQTLGDLGQTPVVKIGSTIDSTDFLLLDPTTNTINFDDSSNFAESSFAAYFTSDTGAIVVNEYGEVNVYAQAKFNNCITYLLFACRKDDPHFKLNGEAYSTRENEDTSSGDFDYTNHSYSDIMDYWEDIISDEES